MTLKLMCQIQTQLPRIIGRSSAVKTCQTEDEKESRQRYRRSDPISFSPPLHIQGVCKVGLHFSAVARWRVFKSMGEN